MMQRIQTVETGILNSLSLSGQVAVVTGGGTDIGRAIAIDLAKMGAKVIVAEKELQEARETSEAIRASGREAMFVAVDVLDSEQMNTMVSEAIRVFGRIDILINHVDEAGQGGYSPITEMDEAVWDSIIALNLKSTFLCTRTVATVMKGQNSGRIINIISEAGLRPYPAQPPYGAAKAALINLTQTMAVQLAPHNIRVNAIAAGTIEMEHENDQIDCDETTRNRGIPLGRTGRVGDVTPAVIFLASDASKYISGVTIEITGGPPFSAFYLEEAQREWASSGKKA